LDLEGAGISASVPLTILLESADLGRALLRLWITRVLANQAKASETLRRSAQTSLCDPLLLPAIGKGKGAALADCRPRVNFWNQCHFLRRPERGKNRN
jgi:hypothetical protein